MVSAGLTGSRLLQMVRVTMPPGQAHEFHRHPLMEEFLYFVSGKAEQWVGEESMILGQGEVAHVPMDVVHGTYNVFEEPAVFSRGSVAGGNRRPGGRRRVAGGTLVMDEGLNTVLMM